MTQVIEAPTTTAAPQTNTQFSTREVPWLKLGKLGEPTGSAAKAAELGGLNFTVEKRPLWYGDSDDTATSQPSHRVSERFAIVRADTGKWLGIMSKNYPLLQYAEAFDFLDHVNPIYVAAGALKGGRQGFVVAQLPEHTVLADVDPHEMFLVLRTSHDGSRAVEAMVMPLRGRCMNQLTLRSFSAGVEHRWAVTHTTNMHTKLAEAQKSLTNLLKYGQAYPLVVRRLIKTKITDDQARGILTDTLPNRPRRGDQVDRIMQLWHTSEQVGFDWTGWGLVNATSEYYDWCRTGGTPESRFLNALQGPTHAVINKVAGNVLSHT